MNINLEKQAAMDTNLLETNQAIALLVSSGKADSVAELVQFPKYLQIETVSNCNARCIMCPIEDWKRDHTLMRPATYSKIIDEIKDYSDWIERVTIQLDGEPLIDKNLEPRIKLLKDIGIKMVAFASNGSLMNAKRAESVIKSGVDEVSFSVDGATKETFEKIRLRLNFDEVVENILNFVATRDRLGADTIVRIRMTIQPENEDEFEEFMNFWQSKLGTNDSVYGKVLHTWGNSNSDKNFALAGGYDFPKLNATPCSSPWTSFIVLTDGRVPLCCCDYNAAVNFGNVRENSIKELWQGQKINNVRQVHVTEGRKAMPMCVNCTVWDDGAKFAEVSEDAP